MSLVAWPLLVLSALPADDPAAIRTPRVYLIGDSTANNGTKGQQGWGTPFAERFDPAQAKVENRARGGRSSRTFLSEGLWDRVRDDLRPGDVVLIQFGHNDGGPIDRGRARASLKGNGEEAREIVADGKAEVVRTYGWYLRRYIGDARARGATPVVLSPVPRNIWRDGDTTVARASGDYGKWAAEAAAQAGAAFLDLNDLVARRYEELGPGRVADLFFGDHTHTAPEGARLTAGLLAAALRDREDFALRGAILAP